jgi:hypothetical protein
VFLINEVVMGKIKITEHKSQEAKSRCKINRIGLQHFLEKGKHS